MTLGIGWKGLPGTNTLAYFASIKVTKKQRFIAETDTSGLYYKTFRSVIYDCNDSTIVDPVL
jgi:hypothetical protein